MSEKIPSPITEQPSSTERGVVNRVELLLPPRQLSVPAGKTLTELVAESRIKTPEIKDGEVNDMNEAYAAALETPPSAEALPLEFSVISVHQLADLNVVSEIDTEHPWRFASPLELILFTLEYPQYLTESPLVALGQTADNHYPLAVTKTGNMQLELGRNVSSVTQIGARVLVVRSSTEGGGKDIEARTLGEDIKTKLFEVIASANSFEARQAQSIRLVEMLSPEQKDEIFDVLAQMLKVRDREVLEELVSGEANQLFGETGAGIQEIVGDTVFEKIIRFMILARLKNAPELSDGGGLDMKYELTEDQKTSIARMMAPISQSDQERAIELLAESDVLNSTAMNTREHAKIVFSCVNSIFKFFEQNRASGVVSEERFAEITKEQNEINRLIGIINGVAFRKMD